jgi:hypothetical protein
MDELGAFAEEIDFHSIGVQFDHRQIWLLFQHILRTSSCTVWPEGWATFIANLDVGDFTRQRHGLHYQLNYWVLDDLHDLLYSQDFSNVAPSGVRRELFDKKNQNFSLTIGVVLTRMALSLLCDLSKLTNRLDTQLATISKTFSKDRHPLFSASLSSLLE